MDGMSGKRRKSEKIFFSEIVRVFVYGGHFDDLFEAVCFLIQEFF